MYRRAAILSVFLGLSALLLPATHAATPAPAMGIEDASHLLNRVAFGASPQEIAAYAGLSCDQAISKVLAKTSAQAQTPIPADVSEYLPRSKVKGMRGESEAARKAFQKEQLRRAMQLRGWWVQEMLAADTPAEQLRERMVLFWHNHFVSSLAKVRSSSVMLEQNQLFRSQALGNFGQLLHAVGKNPAMVVYLDSASNRKGSPNENFAREVMELFTLGEGHYSEQDIKEAARAFTGWSVDPETGAFKWRAFAHDDGQKCVLGQCGNFDGDAVLDILLAQPQTAEFVVAKLWREFISPTPQAAEVQRIARLWRKSNYDMPVVLDALLRSPAFWAAENRGSLIKSPVELVVGSLQRFGLRDVDALPVSFAIAQLGQNLFVPPNVKGWPGGESWINSDTLLARKQLLDRFLRGEPDKSADKGMMGEERGDKGGKLGTGAAKRRLNAAINGIHLDTKAWQTSLGTMRPAQALLALPAAYKGAPDDVSAMLMDVAYQVR